MSQIPIESKFQEMMVDNLNAELVLGTVTNVKVGGYGRGRGGRGPGGGTMVDFAELVLGAVTHVKVGVGGSVWGGRGTSSPNSLILSCILVLQLALQP